MREDRSHLSLLTLTVSRALLCLVPAVLAGGLAPTPAPAQFPWTVLSTPGYATTGLAVAVVPAVALGWNSPELGTAILGAGLAGGAFTGLMIGASAQNHLARGEELSGGHRNALRVGTVMAGAGSGALASYFVIKPKDGDGENDSQIFLSLVAGGAALGVVTQVLLESRLRPDPVRVGLAVGQGGRPEIVLTAKLQ